MKNKRLLLSVTSILILCAISLNFTGCAAEAESPATILSAKVTPKAVSTVEATPSSNVTVTDFAVRLFKASSVDGESTLISPLSVIYALAMTQNGANGETLRQMEAVLGMPRDELNLYLYSYMKALPQGEKYKLSLANSVWFNDAEHFTANEDFLQTNADYFSADIYKAPFNEQTKKDVNNWVDEKTDGMIPEILDKIEPDSVMYLINALAFDAEWEDKYFEDQVSEGEFTREDGTKVSAEFMSGKESRYLEDDNAIGFIKYYKNEKYAFVALLPNEGVSVSEYVASLDGEKLNGMLVNKRYGNIFTKIPKFETDYSVEMSSIISGMGMTDAFDFEKADLSGLGSSGAGDLFIDRVLHKTHIEVGETGTKAGAATLVDVKCGIGGIVAAPPKAIYLDRPFVYMLIDCESNIPFFMGTMMDVSK